MTCSLLVACNSADKLNPDLQLANFSDEAHPIRPVDRSKFHAHLLPTIVEAPAGIPPGTILVDTEARHLYLVKSDGKALRYGIAVGAAGRSWKGVAQVQRKAKWPDWHPTDEMHKSAPGLPRKIAGGAANPLGARALYLYEGGRDTLYRIHGTSEPWTIGTEVSSGCIRLVNEDAIDLFTRVPVGTKVIVR